jgi:hypothetical protein
MALTSAVSGGIQALGNTKARREAEAAQRESQDAFDALMQDYESGKFDAKIAQGEMDLAQMTKTLAEESTQSAVERGREALSAVTAGLRGGDPRSAANISNVLSAVGNQQQQAELAGLQAQVGAEGRLAGLETEAQRRNEALATQMFQYGLDRSAAGIEAARQQANEARNAQLAGIVSGVQGIGQAALYGGIYGGDDKSVTQNTGAGTGVGYQYTPSAQITQPFSYTSPLFGTITGAGTGVGAGATTPAVPLTPSSLNPTNDPFYQGLARTNRGMIGFP